MASSGPFKIVEHVVPCQHIREYPRATAAEQEAVLHLSVKQYIPLDNPNPQPGDITIIGGHANGFPKVRPTRFLVSSTLAFSLALSDLTTFCLAQELYEPLWEEIYTRS